MIAFIFLHQKATLYGLVPRNQTYVPQINVIASGILSDVSLTKGRTHAQTPGIFTMDLYHQTSQPFAEWKSYVEIGANSKSKSCGRSTMALRTWQRAHSSDVKTWQFSVPVHFCHLQLEAKLPSGKAGNWRQFQVWPPVTKMVGTPWVSGTKHVQVTSTGAVQPSIQTQYSQTK